MSLFWRYVLDYKLMYNRILITSYSVELWSGLDLFNKVCLSQNRYLILLMDLPRLFLLQNTYSETDKIFTVITCVPTIFRVQSYRLSVFVSKFHSHRPVSLPLVCCSSKKGQYLHLSPEVRGLLDLFLFYRKQPPKTP